MNSVALDYCCYCFVRALRSKRLISGTAHGFFYSIFLGERWSSTILTIPYRQELMVHSVLFLIIPVGGVWWSLGMIPLKRKMVL